MARPKPTTVEEYLEVVSPNSLEHLNQLRKLIKSLVPEAEEVISYAIPAYKLKGQGRAKVYISGYDKHVSVYPLPHNASEKFMKELQPYIFGKGTARFDLDKPLPIDLITQMVTYLINS